MKTLFLCLLAVCVGYGVMAGWNASPNQKPYQLPAPYQHKDKSSPSPLDQNSAPPHQNDVEIIYI